MAAAPENVLFIDALREHIEELRALLVDEWPYFREHLIAMQSRVEAAPTTAQCSEVVDEIIELLRDSPAEGLIQALLKKALSDAGSEELVTRTAQYPTRDAPETGEKPSNHVDNRGMARRELSTVTNDLTERLLPPEATDYVTVPIFFATDRERAEKGYFSGMRGQLQYGTAAISIPADHRVGELEGPKWWKLQSRSDPRRHVALLEIEVRERDAFTGALRAALRASSEAAILLFIHGYNVTFEEAARRTGQLAYDLNIQGVPMLYSWPSVGRLLRYTVDEGNNEWTEPHLQEVLTLIGTAVGADSIDIIAHSMGNRVLVHALRSLPVTRAGAISQIMLAAPDIDAGVFRNVAKELSLRAKRVTLYASSRDRALKVSKRVHGYVRAGESAGEIVVIPGLMDTIDAIEVDTSLVGHSYYGDNRSILSDVFTLVKDGSAPPRFGMARKEIAGAPYWIFRP
jgi:esterase/lipase superfamily enzyme